MHDIYNFVSGPLVWASFIIFITGSLYRLISMAVLAKKKDVFVYEYMSLKFGLRSILHWITPFGTVKWRKNPIFTMVTFTFHICIIVIPIFLSAHIILWKESLGISWWYISDTVADVLTMVVIAACAFFLVRRILLPEVRYLTTISDYLLIAVVAAPFITGLWTYHQWPGFKVMGILHIIAGEAMLVSIPFTRLVHMLFFPFTRGYMGSEFGAVRQVKDW
jgi:nitrate reductase gamma subunit